MHLATLLAFEEELASIQKEAGLRDVWTRGTKPLLDAYERSGQKAGIHVENLMDVAKKKLPGAEKALKGKNLGHLSETARRLLT